MDAVAVTDISNQKGKDAIFHPICQTGKFLFPGKTSSENHY